MLCIIDFARLSGRIEDRRRGRVGRDEDDNDATATGLGCRPNDDTGNEFDRRGDDCVPGCDSGGIVPTVAA